MPRDLFNREIDYLRISVIDRCNLRCIYCMPLNGIRVLPKAELLTPTEIEAVVRVWGEFQLTQRSEFETSHRSALASDMS